MKHFLITGWTILVLVLGALPLTAQAQSATIKGRVLDAATSQPVPYATVTLNQEGKLITGHSTNDQGQYELGNVPAGSYLLKIGFIGYKDTLQALTIEAGSTYQLPPITLRTNVLELGEVVVRGEKTTIANLIDKRVVNVGQDLLATGASAVEILANVPSVQTDPSGNVSLRGNRNVTVLVDGKPSPLPNNELLQQLAASSIDKIEVITAPSAKYNPDGATGVINIITQRSQQGGFNSNFVLGAATGRKYNAGLDASYARGKWNSFVNYSFAQRQFRHAEEQHKLVDESNTNFSQQTRMLFDGDGNTLKVGADYFLNKTNTLSLYTNQSRQRHTLFNRWQFLETQAGNATAQYRRDAQNPHDHLTQDYNLSYRKTLPAPGHVLEAEVNLSNNRNSLDGRYQQTYLLGGAGDTLTTEEIQYDNRILTLTADYSRPLLNQAKLELGWQSIVKDASNDYQPGTEVDGLPVLDEANRNLFRYAEQTHALYGVYGSRWQKLSFQLGLRLEQALITADLRTTGQRFENNYFNLFPSAHGSYALSEQQAIKLSYSRRITRPSLWNVNPYTNVTNPLSIRQGNPFLRPEYINSLELGYQRESKLADLSATLFYRYRTDIISTVFELANERTTILTFANTGTSHSYGLELNGTVRPVKPWNVRGSLNYYRNTVNYRSEGRFNSQLRSWDFLLQNQVDLSKKLSLDLLWKYEGPLIDLQETSRARQKIDVGLRLKCLNDKGNLSLQVADVLDSFEYRSTELGNGFLGRTVWDGETRIGYLTFNYKLAAGQQPEKSARKRRVYQEKGSGE